MKSAIIVSFLLFLGSFGLQAQTTTTTSATGVPDKSWVLKDYPNATDIRWHREKNGQTEFEFINGQKETKVWFTDAGQVVKTRVEGSEKKENHEGHEAEEKDDDDRK